MQYTVYSPTPPLTVYWKILAVYSIQSNAPPNGILEVWKIFTVYSILENLYSIQYTEKVLQYAVYSIVKIFRASGAVYSIVKFFHSIQHSILLTV